MNRNRQTTTARAEDGANSTPANGTERRTARRALPLATLGLALALVLGVSDVARAAPGGKNPEPLPSHPPTAPYNECAQRCFSDYMKNIGQCASQFCNQVLFFTFCDNDGMTQCQANAQAVFEACLISCGALT